MNLPSPLLWKYALFNERTRTVVVDEWWTPIGDHKPLEVESRLTFGAIQVPHSIPLAARFFAGNAQHFFVSKTIPEASQDLSALKALALPIGWSETKYPWMVETGQDATYTQRFSGVNLAIVVTGWLLTAIAMTLGAPFWFDTSNKFMVVRSTIKPREKSEDEASKDAQSK